MPIKRFLKAKGNFAVNKLLMLMSLQQWRSFYREGMKAFPSRKRLQTTLLTIVIPSDINWYMKLKI